MKSKLIKFTLASILIAGALTGCVQPTPQEHVHSFDEGTIRIQPTETSEGLKVFTCSGCGQTQNEILPATGTTTCNHQWDNGTVTTAPTATAEGVKTFTCSVCGAKSYEILPATGGQENPNKFKVTYNANGGSGTDVVDSNEYESGDRVTVKANTYTAPEGFEFINWNEEPNASGRYYNVGTSFKIYEDITLYAQWLEIEDEGNEHAIKVNAPAGANCELSHTRAEAGTVVTLTITLENSAVLNGDPSSTQTSLTRKNDGVYTFVMPDVAVTIDVKTTIDGDVILTGDITAKLTDSDNDGVYTAEVDCSAKTSYSFTYYTKDNNGSPKRLKSLNLDETRCDANITFTSGDNELLIAGGAKYIFSYDSNSADYNCYVTRKEVTTLPSNPKTLYNLFDGKMRSQSTIHPQGLTGISYTKKVNGTDATLGYKPADVTYTYKKISDTESFAVTANRSTGNESKYVYKNIDATNNIYSIVNTYTKGEGNNEAPDNAWPVDPYGDMQGNRYFPYSAKQDIVANNLYSNTSRYQITEREAIRNINSAAHYGSDLEYEIYQSLRGDFDGTAMINAANGEGSNVSIVSTKTATGFRVRVKSQLEYNHEESGSTADVTQQYAFVYDATLAFLTNGDLSSLEYVEKYYTKDNWNFTAHTPLAGGTCIETDINVTNDFNKTYDRATVLGGFNPNDYFITSIDKLSFYDSETKIDKSSTESILNFDDSLDIIEYLGGGEPTKLVDEFKFSPETALDAWQYGCINSSDKGVVDETPWGPKTVGVGNATITFGNHLANISGPTKDVNVSVYAGGTFHSIYVDCYKQGYDSFNGPHAEKIIGYAGKTMTYYIDSGTNTGCPVSYYLVIKDKDQDGDTVKTDTSPYFNVVNGNGFVDEGGKHFVKVVGHELTIDFNTEAANALTSSISVFVIFRSEFYEPGYGPTTMEIIINPAQDPILNTKWGCSYMQKENPTKKFEDVTIEFGAGTGTITEKLFNNDGTTVRCTNVYNFTYTELNNGNFNCKLTSVVIGEAEMPTKASDYKLAIVRTQDNKIGVCLYSEELEDPILGAIDEDGEGYFFIEGYTAFERIVG